MNTCETLIDRRSSSRTTPGTRKAVMPRARLGALRCQRSADLSAYMPLVRKIVGRLRRRLPASVDLDDLTQVGLIGLNDAMSRFEQGQGSTFETYAARRIEGAMLDTLRANDLLPREVRTRLKNVKQAVKRLEHRLGRAPRAKEVANELGWTLDEVHRSMVDAGAGGMRTGDAGLELCDESASDAYPGGAMNAGMTGDCQDPLRALEVRKRHAVLSAAFDALEEAERYVMDALYERDLTLEAVGEELGVTASRVSQIRSRIVEKLRRRLRDA